MDIQQLLKDKTIKGKEKVETLSKAVLHESVKPAELLDAAIKAKGADRGTCVEAMEFVTRSNPEMCNKACLDFMVVCLEDKAPRVRWESAKVIGNVAALYATKLDEAITKLLANTEHPGTVVRWSAAYALTKIVEQKTKHNKDLIPAIEAITEREENNAIRKMYLTCLKKYA